MELFINGNWLLLDAEAGIYVTKLLILSDFDLFH